MGLQIGDKVHCLAGNIDKNLGVGEIGYVTGFARFSKYHPREAYISDKPQPQSPTTSWAGWFWVRDLKKID